MVTISGRVAIFRLVPSMQPLFKKEPRYPLKISCIGA